MSPRRADKDVSESHPDKAKSVDGHDGQVPTQDVPTKSRDAKAPLFSQDTFRDLLDSMPDAMVIVDETGIMRHVNREMERMFGYAREDIVGQPVELLIPKPFHDAHRDQLRGFFGETRDRPVESGNEFAAVTKEGREFPADISLRSLEIEGERVVIAAVRDITDRKHAEHALQERKDFLSRLIDTQQTIVLMLDLNGRIVMFNRYAEKVTGYAADEVMGKDWFATFLPEEERSRVRTFFDLVLKEGGHTAHTDPIVSKSGQLREIEWYGRILEDDDGAAIGMLSTGQDVTQRRSDEERLRNALNEADRANRAKSQFMAAASHDLRQPLQSLILYMGALERKEVPPDILDIVTRMKVSLGGMRELLDSLLDITRYDSGQVEPEIKNFQIAEVLQQAEADVRPLAEEKGLKFHVVQSSAVVTSDPVLLDRVVQNFLFNAVRYTDKGTVLCGCRRRENSLRIEVWDTGPGISDEDKDRIFQEFVQLKNPSRERKKGLGLGLAIVDRIARLLGHRIDLVSALGRGSVFSIEVPMSAAERCKPAGSTKYEPLPTIGKKSALVVEDDPEVRASLETLLALECFNVASAADGKDANDIIERSDSWPDIIVSDYNLSCGSDGIEVIRQARQFYGKRIPAILITGETSGRIMRQAEANDCRVLHKPVEADALINLVRALLNEPD